VSAFDINYDDLESLEAHQLQELLGKLIYAECYQYKIGICESDSPE